MSAVLGKGTLAAGMTAVQQLLFSDASLHKIGQRLWSYFIDHHLLGQPMLVTLGALLVMACEVPLRGWQQSALYRLFVRRSMSARIDLVFWALQTLGLAAIIEMVFTLGISYGGEHLAQIVQQRVDWYRFPLPGDGPVEIAFSFVAFWIVSGFFGYWVHRIYHGRAFWRVHRFHHAAEELNFVTALRLHPVESLTRVLLPLSPLTFMHVPDSVLVLSVFAGSFINYCQHSEVDSDWGWVGRWIFGGPKVHQFHHSIDDEHRDVNFGNCPLWDHLFGTWYGGVNAPSAYGTIDHAYNEHPGRQFSRDALDCYRLIGAWLVTPLRKSRGAPAVVN
jgi:sterol desaturase/sphingolipid hydroxylase (fatty acid hydroxylase superfamily)